MSFKAWPNGATLAQITSFPTLRSLSISVPPEAGDLEITAETFQELLDQLPQSIESLSLTGVVVTNPEALDPAWFTARPMLERIEIVPMGFAYDRDG